MYAEAIIRESNTNKRSKLVFNLCNWSTSIFIYVTSENAYFHGSIVYLLVLFCDWLRGVEEAKNIKRFMTYRVIVLLIGVVLLVQYFLSMYREEVKPLYMFAWFILLFITDFIEKKCLLKQNNVNTNLDKS
ncbi:hypothetical protein BU012_12640 [Mammaliicoccus sciuri]|nr:hypothetical protein BU012_12640 [Mammaliicoccus sciuri]